MNNNVILKPIQKQDEPILWTMLYEATHFEEQGKTMDDLKNTPDLAKYVINWGQDHDLGYIALSNGNAVGAAWIRLFTNKTLVMDILMIRHQNLLLDFYMNIGTKGLVQNC